MKKLFVLLFLLLLAFIVWNRNRVYLRDPLATVRRDGNPVSGAKVMINYTNDVLLEDSSVAGRRRIYLVQHWNQKLETPTAVLQCLYGLACLADKDRATGEPIGSRVILSSTGVSFLDENGAAVNVQLR